MKKRKLRQPVERFAYTVNETLDSGAFANRNKLYDALARGDLDSWKDGRTRMISAASLRRYVERKASGA